MISASRLFKAALISFTLAATAWGVSKINMFGLEGASDRLADGVFQRITAASYGPDRKGQQAVSVVYLDEESVDNLKGFGWTRFPPSFDQQWTMLDDILQAGGAPPAGIFVDFVYLGQGGPAEGFETFRSGVAAATKAEAWADKPACAADPLMKISCIVAAGGTPIVFARPSAAELNLFTDLQKSLDRVSILAPGPGERGRLSAPHPLRGHARRPAEGAGRARLRHLAGGGDVRGLLPEPRRLRRRPCAS